MTQANQVSTTAQQANKFTFRDASNSTQIVYYPEAPGPIAPGGPGPQLEYQGSEGSFTFKYEEVEQQDSPLGDLITVTLKPNLDAGGLMLTLLLPSVDMGDKQQQAFDTVAIKAKSVGFILNHEGARLTYDVVCLQGLAETVILPF